jgi:conjugative transfer pilus assembly protein TraH
MVLAKRLLSIVIPLLMGLFSGTLHAGLESDLQSFFSKLNEGSVTNVTQGGAYKGQEGGFYTGGSLFMRSPSRNVQIMNLQMPKIEAGCAGIDLHMGGLGYINSAKLIETLKSIGGSSLGYAFSLALKQISPQIMNQIEELQSWANEANWNNINSCEAASKLVNNAAAVFHGESVRSCITQVLKNKNEDYFSARKNCQNQSEVNAKNKEAAEQGEAVMDDINIVWDTIQKNDNLKALDPELQWLFMSLTGTIVVSTVGEEPPSYQIYASKLEDNTLIESLLTGKPVEVYGCTDPKCLSPSTRTITLNESQGFVAKVSTMIANMATKVIEDKDELSTEEKAFLESTSLPLYKMLNVYGAFTQGTALLFPTHYAEIIALDMLCRYIKAGITALAPTAQNPHFPKTHTKQFSSMLDKAQARMIAVQALQIQRTGTLDDMVAKVQMMEKQITARVSAQIFSHL